MQIKWFSIEDIKREAHFRPFFNNIIKKLIDNEDIITRNMIQLTNSAHSGMEANKHKRMRKSIKKTIRKTQLDNKRRTSKTKKR